MIKGGHNRRGAYFRMTYIVGISPLLQHLHFRRGGGVFSFGSYIYNEHGLQYHKSPF